MLAISSVNITYRALLADGEDRNRAVGGPLVLRHACFRKSSTWGPDGYNVIDSHGRESVGSRSRALAAPPHLTLPGLSNSARIRHGVSRAAGNNRSFVGREARPI